ncbi:tail fiber domain-containing protein [candidate division KSB1 bacterium]|nr:tail fiber domain-containing protein [candidate division KSB1 bacterium]
MKRNFILCIVILCGNLLLTGFSIPGFAQMLVTDSAENPIMIVTEEGLVGLGTTTPRATIEIIGTGGMYSGPTWFGGTSNRRSNIDITNEDVTSGNCLGIISSVNSPLSYGTDNYYYSAIAGNANTDDGAYILAAGQLGTSQIKSPARRFITGVWGSLDGNRIGAYADVNELNSAVFAWVNNNSVASENVYAIAAQGAKSYFEQNVGIGIRNPQTMLAVTLNPATEQVDNVMIDAQGNFWREPVSSKRYKENIAPMDDSYMKILNATPVTFNYIGTDYKTCGLIAEELEELGIKEMVKYKNGQVEGVDYDKLPIYLLGVIKEMQSEIDELREKIKE